MIAVIDYGAGNIRSVMNALKRLGTEAVLTSDATEIRAADRVLFPGVGQAAFAREKLSASGLDTVIPDLVQPVLGICLGMQLMCRHTEEGNTPGLGIFDVAVRQFPPEDRIPHMGWNHFTEVSDIPLLRGIVAGDDVYYAHGYFAGLGKETGAKTNYILPFSSVLHRANFYGTQFHPEKSSRVGMQVLSNFLNL